MHFDEGEVLVHEIGGMKEKTTTNVSNSNKDYQQHQVGKTRGFTSLSFLQSLFSEFYSSKLTVASYYLYKVPPTLLYLQ